MNYNCVLAPSLVLDGSWPKGGLYVGSRVDEKIYQLPGPLVIVNMDDEVDDVCWVKRTGDEERGDTSHIQGVLHIGIRDWATGVLPDPVYLAYVNACHALMERGINLYIHCQAGISRSPYLALGILCKRGLTFMEAWGLIQNARPFALPNKWFAAQVRRLAEEGRF